MKREDWYDQYDSEDDLDLGLNAEDLDPEIESFLNTAHHALSKLSEKTHKRKVIKRRTKPVEGWH